MLVLYIVLLLCTIALVWTAVAIFALVRKHLRERAAHEHEGEKKDQVTTP